MNNQSIKYQGLVPFRLPAPRVTGFRQFTPRITNFARRFAPIADVAGTTFLGTAPGTFSNVSNFMGTSGFTPTTVPTTADFISTANANNLAQSFDPNFYSSPLLGNTPYNPSGSLTGFFSPSAVNSRLQSLGGAAGLGVGVGMPATGTAQQFIDASAYMAEGTPSAATTTPSAATTPSTTTTTSAATTPSGAQEVVTTSATPADSASIEQGISNVDATATAADSTKAGLETTLGQDLTPPPFMTTEQANTQSGLNIPARAYDLLMEGDYTGAAALAAGYQLATRPRPKSLTDINLKNTKQGDIPMRPDQYVDVLATQGFGQFRTQLQSPLLSERFIPVGGRAASRARAYGLLGIDATRLDPYASTTAAPLRGQGVFSRKFPVGKKKREENFNKLLSEEQSIPLTTQKSVLENVSLVDDQASANYGNVGGRLSLINDNIQVPISVNRDNVTVVALDNNSNPIVAVQNVGGDGKPILFAKTDKGFLPLESDLNLTSPKPATRLSGKKAHRDDFFIGEGSTGTAFTPAEGSNLAKLGQVLDNKNFNYEVYVQNKKTVPTINITSGGDLGSAKQLPPMEGSFPGLGVYNLGTPEIPRPMPNFIGPALPSGNVYRTPGFMRAPGYKPGDGFSIKSGFRGDYGVPVPFVDDSFFPPGPRDASGNFVMGNITPKSDPMKLRIEDPVTGRNILEPTIDVAGKQVEVIQNNNLLPGVVQTTDGYFILNPNTKRYEPFKGQDYYENGGTVMFNPFMR